MKKRLLLVIMAAVMLLTMLAGCSDAKKPTEADKNPPIENTYPVEENLTGKIKDIEMINLALPENEQRKIDLKLSENSNLGTASAHYELKSELKLGEKQIESYDFSGSIYFVDSLINEKQTLLKEEFVNEDEPWDIENKMYYIVEAIDDHRFIYLCKNAYLSIYSGIYDVNTNKNQIFEHDGKAYVFEGRVGDTIYCSQAINMENEKISRKNLDILEIDINSNNQKHYTIDIPENYKSHCYSPDFKMMAVITAEPVTEESNIGKCELLLHKLPNGEMFDSKSFEFELDFREGIAFYPYVFYQAGTDSLYLGYQTTLYELNLYK